MTHPFPALRPSALRVRLAAGRPQPAGCRDRQPSGQCEPRLHGTDLPVPQAGFPGRSGQRPRWCARGVGATAAHQHPRRTRAVEPMTVASSKWMLAAIWLVGAGGVFLLLVAQSLLGRYEPATHEVGGGFLRSEEHTPELQS